MVTDQQLRKIMPFSSSTRRAILTPALCKALDEFDISTNLRIAAFLAQIAHESGSLTYLQEIASGAAYEGRADLGNTQPGDGVRYKGRGLIQITGRANYLKCGEALGLDLIANPNFLTAPDPAAKSAAWFWKTHGCNELADTQNFDAITKKINGGLNGKKERDQFYAIAKEINFTGA